MTQKVVHPDNMGKGLAWNATSKKYDVNAKDANGVVVNSDGTVGVALSDDTGNLLELRSDGLYYGLTAAPDKRVLYVSTTLGNDKNVGTRDAPLKTIGGAFAVIGDSGQHHEIRLRAGEAFELGFNNASNTSIDLTSYDQWISNWEKVPYYRPQSSTKWNRPIVTVRKRQTSDYVVSRDRINCRMFNAIGIYFVLDDTDIEGTENLTGNIAGFINATSSIISFEGCIFKFVNNRSFEGYFRDAWLRVGGVTMLNCKFENTPESIKTPEGRYSRWVYHAYHPTININVWIDSVDGNGIYEALTPIISSETEAKAVFTLDNICTNAAYDKNTKSIFNCAPTWDIFANN